MSPLFLLLVAAATAGSPDCTVVVGATAFLPQGFVEDTDVVLRGERIAAVGRTPPGLRLVGDASAPESATFDGRPCAIVQARGKVLTPGFVEVGTQLGLVEVSGEPSSRHDRGGDAIQAALRASDGYDPLSTLIPVQRGGGITGAVVAPSGGWISGQGAFVRLTGSRWRDAVVVPSVAMFARLGGGSVPDRILALRELAHRTDAWARGGRPLVEPVQVGGQEVGVLDLEAFVPVFRGQLPLVVDADRSADIEALLRWREASGVRLVVRGAAEGWIVADALAEAGVPVIVNPYVYGAGSFDQDHGRPDNPARLAAAGVPLIVSSFETHNARNLRQLAGNAVRDGLDPVEALRAITSTPAQVFGLEGRGVIAPGAHADLVLWTGDPLELSSRVEAMWIGGARQSLRSRHTELFEAYRRLPGSPRPALPLP